MKKSFSLNTNLNEIEIIEIGLKLFKTKIYQAIEIRYPYDMLSNCSDSYEKGIKHLLDEYKIEISQHIDYGLDIGTSSKSIREQVIETIKKSVDFGIKYGAKIFVIHPGGIGNLSYVKNPDNDSDKRTYDIFIERRKLAAQKTAYMLNIIADYLKQSKSIIALENVVSEKNAAISANELINIIEMTDKENIKCTYDIAHATVAKQNVYEFPKILRDKLVHVHVSDNFGLCDNHNHIGKGIVDFDSAFKALRELDYKGMVVVESLYKSIQEQIESARELDKYM